MVHQNSVSLDAMRGQLKTLDWVHDQFAQTEPLTEIPFEAGQASLRLEEGWVGESVKEGLTDYVDAWLRVPGHDDEYQLTKQAALEVGAAVGIPRVVQATSDPVVLVPLINSRLERVLDSKGLKALGRENRVLGLTRGTVSPFSNLRLLEVMTAGLRKKYGDDAEILADYKFANDLEHTGLRLIVPGQTRVITGTSVADDTWSAGLDFSNSLTGLRRLEINGQLFRWWCTNGCTDTLHSVGGLPRRGTTEEDAIDWAARTVDEVLGGLETMLDHVQSLTSQPIAGNVGDTLAGLFSEYGVPSPARHRIIEAMAEDDEMTAYSLMQAVTEAANIDGIRDRERQRLMRMGGAIAGTHNVRCNLGRVHRAVQEEAEAEAPAVEELV